MRTVIIYDIYDFLHLSHLKGTPFEIVSDSLSNAVTPLHSSHASAYDIFLKIKNKYGIGIYPNGGDLKYTIFRTDCIGA